MIKICPAMVLLILFLAGCGPGEPPAEAPAELTVSAAVSLRDAFTEIAELFERRTGVEVRLNFGSSGGLLRQIENGAPVDVFASAGSRQMDELAAAGLIDTATRADFAQNELVLIVRSDAAATVTGFADLADPTITKIAVGNPKTVPAGQYTQQFFQSQGLSEALEGKLIVAEDVRQVLDHVARGEVDAGIVYSTDAHIAGDKVRVIVTLPGGSHDPIMYPIAVIRDTKADASARQFVELVTGAEGQAVLTKYGFVNGSKR